MNKDKLGRPSWDDYFMALALVAAMRSPDPSTKHGSVICDSSRRIIGIGYNGFLRGSDDMAMPLTRPDKYAEVCHSEINSLLNAQLPSDRSGCSIYVTGHPCVNCLNAIIQSGISRIVYGPVASACVSEEDKDKMLIKCKRLGITMEKYNGDMTRLLEDAIGYLNKKVTDGIEKELMPELFPA